MESKLYRLRRDYGRGEYGNRDAGRFYDGVGTLRDMVQNHLAQLLAVTAMEPPAAFDASGFRNEVVKVYQSLTPLTGEDIRHSVVRGQYMASEGRKGYREEEQVPALSRTETYLGYAVGTEQLALGRRTFLYPHG